MTSAFPILTLSLASLLALGVSLGTAEAQTTACDSNIRTVEINNTTLHYLECGQGEPLVFVHGALGDLHFFQPKVQAFAAHYGLVMLPTKPSIHVADLRALMKQLNAAPAHLVGNSGGAYIALALALDHPEVVRSLVLGEPPVMSLLSRTSVGEDLLQSWVRRVMAPARKAFEGGDLEDGLRKFMDAICGTGCLDNPPQFFPRRPVLVETQAPELRSQFMTEPSANLPSLDCGQMGKLTRPTLLLTGEQSPAIFFLITAELERCLEGESQVMVPDAGHTMHRENTALYNQAVLAFLQRR